MMMINDDDDDDDEEEEEEEEDGDDDDDGFVIDHHGQYLLLSTLSIHMREISKNSRKILFIFVPSLPFLRVLASLCPFLFPCPCSYPPLLLRKFCSPAHRKVPGDPNDPIPPKFPARTPNICFPDENTFGWREPAGAQPSSQAGDECKRGRVAGERRALGKGERRGRREIWGWG
eukprot:185355-Hanusia_phi.AAC.4